MRLASSQFVPKEADSKVLERGQRIRAQRREEARRPTDVCRGLLNSSPDEKGWWSYDRAKASARRRSAVCVWTLVIVGGLSRSRGFESDVDVSFDCGSRPDYRALPVDFRSVRHTLSITSPFGSRSPCQVGPARRQAAIRRHSWACRRNVSDRFIFIAIVALQKKIRPALTARHGLGSGALQKLGEDGAHGRYVSGDHQSQRLLSRVIALTMFSRARGS
jgi:hypothetical protein